MAVVAEVDQGALDTVDALLDRHLRQPNQDGFGKAGGNIDLNTLDRVIERGLASDGRLCRFTATISDRPGGLARFAGLIAEEGASVVDIEHDRAFSSEDINTVNVHCVVETRDKAHIATLKNRLEREGFKVGA